jgi:hypothetical protein
MLTAFVELESAIRAHSDTCLHLTSSRRKTVSESIVHTTKTFSETSLRDFRRRMMKGSKTSKRSPLRWSGAKLGQLGLKMSQALP